MHYIFYMFNTWIQVKFVVKDYVNNDAHNTFLDVPEIVYRIA